MTTNVYETHADWCEHLWALGLLAEDHERCPAAYTCVAAVPDER